MIYKHGQKKPANTQLISTGQRQRSNVLRPTLIQGDSTRFQRRARGTDIVYQQDTLTRQTIIDTDKSVANVLFALHCIQIDLGGGRSVSHEGSLVYRQPGMVDHFAGQQGRLIVSSLAQTLRVQRHGNDDVDRVATRGPIVGHQSTQRFGQRKMAIVFKVMDRFLNEALETGHRPHGLDS